MCVSVREDAHKSQKGVSDPLELELELEVEAVGTPDMRAKSQTQVLSKNRNALNHWAISPGQRAYFTKGNSEVHSNYTLPGSRGKTKKHKEKNAA